MKAIVDSDNVLRRQLYGQQRRLRARRRLFEDGMERSGGGLARKMRRASRARMGSFSGSVGSVGRRRSSIDDAEAAAAAATAAAVPGASEPGRKLRLSFRLAHLATSMKTNGGAKAAADASSDGARPLESGNGGSMLQLTASNLESLEKQRMAAQASAAQACAAAVVSAARADGAAGAVGNLGERNGRRRVALEEVDPTTGSFSRMRKLSQTSVTSSVEQVIGRKLSLETGKIRRAVEASHHAAERANKCHFSRRWSFGAEYWPVRHTSKDANGVLASSGTPPVPRTGVGLGDRLTLSTSVTLERRRADWLDGEKTLTEDSARHLSHSQRARVMGLRAGCGNHRPRLGSVVGGAGAALANAARRRTSTTAGMAGARACASGAPAALLAEASRRSSLATSISAMEEEDAEAKGANSKLTSTQRAHWRATADNVLRDSIDSRCSCARGFTRRRKISEKSKLEQTVVHQPPRSSMAAPSSPEGGDSFSRASRATKKRASVTFRPRVASAQLSDSPWQNDACAA